MNKTQSSTGSILGEMLRENVGRSLCDSGGTPKYKDGKYAGSEAGYGRGFEINKGRDLSKQPVASLRVDAERMEFEVTLNVYPWLKERCEFHSDLDKRYQRFARNKRAHEHEMVLMGDFIEKLLENGENVTGLYGEEDSNFNVVNTYNGEDALSQTLQYIYFELDRKPYVLLQIHGGCDVRGGYTKARVFALNSQEAMFQNADVELIADDPDADKHPGETHSVYWQSEDAGWTFRLSDYELWDRKSKGRCPDLNAYTGDGFPRTNDMSLRGKGYIVFDLETNTVYCPVTGWPLSV